jgi:hypothetical protein
LISINVPLHKKIQRTAYSGTFPASSPYPNRLLPILEIPGYRREWLMPDVFAGTALWAVMVSEGRA